MIVTVLVFGFSCAQEEGEQRCDFSCFLASGMKMFQPFKPCIILKRGDSAPPLARSTTYYYYCCELSNEKAAVSCIYNSMSAVKLGEVNCLESGCLKNKTQVCVSIATIEAFESEGFGMEMK